MPRVNLGQNDKAVIQKGIINKYRTIRNGGNRPISEAKMASAIGMKEGTFHDHFKELAKMPYGELMDLLDYLRIPAEERII